MKKALSFITGAMLLLVLCLHVKAQSTTITWVNGPSPKPGFQYCVQITHENGLAVSSTSYYCPEQPADYLSYDCVPNSVPQTCYGSLYLPGLTLEDITITWGNPDTLTYNTDGSIHTFKRTDTLDAGAWMGTTTQTYQNVKQTYCNGPRGCRTVLVAQAVSGSGTLVAQ